MQAVARPTLSRSSISHHYRRRQLNTAGRYILLMMLVILFMAPFVWLFITALKTPAELAAFPVLFWPTEASWNNFVQALTSINFLAYAANSLTLSLIYALLVTCSSALVGFGFARLKGKGKQVFFLLMLSTLMVPQIVTAIPTYMIFSRVGLIDTYWPWVFWGIGTSPFLVFLFRQFFSAIPTELEEAAILDGCGYFRIFWQIFLPLSVPVIATALVTAFTWTWGDFVTQVLFLNQDNTTLSVAMTIGYLDPHGNPLTTVQAAGSIIYILPVLVVFFFAQKAFVRGIATSGVKG